MEDPRAASAQIKLTTYRCWFDEGSWLARPRYLFLDFPAPITCLFMRFRLGCHDLQIELGRWEDRRPRHLRFCQRCSMGLVDDERHLVFECPAFDQLRCARQHLFCGIVDADVRRFMLQRDQAAVLGFVLDCLRYEGPSSAVRDLDCDLDLQIQLDTFDE